MAVRLEATKYPGIYRAHAAGCGRKDCRCPYQAAVWSAREGKRIRRHFPTMSAAKSWREDAQGALRRGTMKAPTATTVQQAADAWLEGVRAGTIVSRKREPYKPSAIRSYERALKLRVLPALGHMKLSAVTRNDVQDLADRLLAGERPALNPLDPSTVQNTLNPLQAIYRRALARGDVAVNPTAGLELPKATGRRDRIASAEEAAQLLAALPVEERALWATALYAGLRRGELRALREFDVDLAVGVIRIERSWDDQEGEVEAKTKAGRRTVPISAALRDHLVEHRMRRTGNGNGDALVFGTADQEAFEPSTVRRRALAAWGWKEKRKRGRGQRTVLVKVREDALAPIGLHEARHTFASLMIAAGVNAKALCSYMGHASVTITFDRYGHLMPGNEAEAAGLLDAYLERSDTAARMAAVAGSG